MLVMLHNLLRNYFGSARHYPAAMLKKHRKHIDNDVTLSFINVTDMSIGENIIALLRILRLRDPLVATIH